MTATECSAYWSFLGEVGLTGVHRATVRQGPRGPLAKSGPRGSLQCGGKEASQLDTVGEAPVHDVDEVVTDHGTANPLDGRLAGPMREGPCDGLPPVGSSPPGSALEVG